MRPLPLPCPAVLPGLGILDRVTPHLVWDWNGTLLDDLRLVVDATNSSLASVGGPVVTADEHRRGFRRPISAYYADVLGRQITAAEFVHLDGEFHRAYRAGLARCALKPDATAALAAWSGTQSLLSMWFHADLVALVSRYGLTPRFTRIDGLRADIGGGHKEEHLVAHLEALGLTGAGTVLVGDSLDDAHAAAAVGARCVLYAGGFTDLDQLVASGLPVASTLLEAVEMSTELVVEAGVEAGSEVSEASGPRTASPSR